MPKSLTFSDEGSHDRHGLDPSCDHASHQTSPRLSRQTSPHLSRQTSPHLSRNPTSTRSAAELHVRRRPSLIMTPSQPKQPVSFSKLAILPIREAAPDPPPSLSRELPVRLEVFARTDITVEEVQANSVQNGDEVRDYVHPKCVNLSARLSPLMIESGMTNLHPPIGCTTVFKMARESSS